MDGHGLGIICKVRLQRNKVLLSPVDTDMTCRAAFHITKKGFLLSSELLKKDICLYLA